MNEKEQYANQWKIQLAANDIKDALKQLQFLTEYAFLNVEESIEIRDENVLLTCVKQK